MEKLHVLSVKTSNDVWEIRESTYCEKEAIIKKLNYRKTLSKNQVKLEHFTLDLTEHAYKITCGIHIKANSTLQVDSIAIAPNLLKSLEQSDEIDKELKVRYCKDNNFLYVYLYATSDVHALHKVSTVIENQLVILLTKGLELKLS